MIRKRQMGVRARLIFISVSGVLIMGMIGILISGSFLSSRGRQEVAETRRMMVENEKQKLADHVGMLHAFFSRLHATDAAETVQGHVDLACGMLAHIYETAGMPAATSPDTAVPRKRALPKSGYAGADTRMDPGQLRQEMLSAVERLRYGDNGYFWIMDLHPRMILHPGRPELEGLDVTDFTGPDGTKPFAAIADMCAETDEGRLSFLWSDDDPANAVPVTAYVKRFTPLNWIIGTTVPANSRTGTAAMQQALETLRSMSGDARSHSFFWVLDDQGAIVLNPFGAGKETDTRAGGPIAALAAIAEKAAEKGPVTVEQLLTRPGGATPDPVVIHARSLEPWGWTLGAVTWLDSVESEMAGKRSQIIAQKTGQFLRLAVITVLVCMAMILFAVIVSRRIVAPMRQTTAMLEDIAQGAGDLTRRLEVTGTDEMGMMAVWVNRLMEQLARIMSGVTQRAETFIGSSASLLDISRELETGARRTSRQLNTIAASMEQLSSNARSMASAMEESATNVDMVATSSEQMTATINEIAQNSEMARQDISRAAARSKEAFDRIADLSQAAGEIDRITETITEISEQTNLLALNATIEAARAGEAGKGFAVVADEIKKLAGQTADATEEIKDLIRNIQTATGATAASVEDASSVISGVQEVVSSISAAMEQQSVGTREITANIAQVALAVQEVSRNVQQSSSTNAEVTRDLARVSLSSGELADISTKLSGNAQSLSTVAEELKQLVDQFKV
ncbi:methyl-accepting chemotaxis protein [Desulfosudis oleivorans]|uniref:Methyl-accepting chemotaxis sensory transducer n=1 Tax=Desulfosudis oleivorans (strain DSM 6200 / JCM 39069 / Hxd3) TaxID=96561 RepID=A9A0T0_DESOH|nr:methyl-accepting chemotaxis protein [Desulfosudis oleivorans]ABW67555.1 methyl-accepting chemotaxis sensory transducer [Desulfosudis oleivorans Hxd3]